MAFWNRWSSGLRQRIGELNPRDQRALGIFAAALAATALAIAVFLVHASLADKADRNRDRADVIRLVRERGGTYRTRLIEQEALNHRLAAEMRPLPSIIGEVLAELGQQRQDFQELSPDPFGPAGQRQKPWIRLGVNFKIRKVSAEVVLDFLVRLRDRYPELPLAVTLLDMRLDGTEANLYNVDMVVSGYRLAEEPNREAGGAGGASGAPHVRDTAKAGTRSGSDRP
jgi:hypothetical protein